MSVCIHADTRSELTRSELQKLRKEGRLPGVVFGKDTPATMIHISIKDFNQWRKTGHPRVIQLDIDGNRKIPVLLEGLQRNSITRDLIHVDFLHVRMNELVKTRIPIEYIGSAKGLKLGGAMQTQGTSIEVEGLPGKLPSTIEVNVSDLGVGDSLQVKDIEIPEGITVLSADDELLVSVVSTKRNLLVEEEAQV